MMLDEEIEVKVNPSQLKHFKSLGLNVKPNETIKIKPEQLNSGSNIKITCKCDVCGKIKKQPYRRYLKSINNGGYYSCSVKCAQEKTKNTFIEKYGEEHHFKTKKTKDKIKSTWNKKYGEKHFSHSEEYKKRVTDIVNKRKKTIYEKYVKDESLISIDDKKIVKHCVSHNGNYEIDKKLYHNRKRIGVNCCTICFQPNETSSIKEIELYDFINSKTPFTVERLHKVDNKEIDVYIPKLNLGFEFNGLYWHNEIHRENDYHKNKTDHFIENGIQLIHIWEDDWDNKREIVKSRINNLLGVSDKIYGRKCTVVELGPKEYKNFLEKNHIQGSVNSSIKLGLYHKNELVSVMGLGSLRRSLGYKSKKGYYELLRFCNKLDTSVVGGASKLFKHFIKKYNPKEVISYADRSWSKGDLYQKLGFNFVNKTKPNYYYIINKVRLNRYNFRKDRLVKEGFDPNKTEKEIMISRGVYRIYDSGSLLYVYKNRG